MGDLEEPELVRLRQRYDRERRIREEAEAIAEATTRRLYHVAEELARSKEELEKLYAAQRDFIAIASHELQTPIAPIAGFASTMLARWGSMPDGDKRKYVEAIDRQAKRLSELTQAFLAISRIDAGAVEVRPQVIGVGEAIHETLKELGDGASQVGVSCPEDLQVLADPNHLHQILGNYLTNALRHGAGAVEIEAEGVGRWVELRVRDSGEGVPDEFVPRLFEKFARAGSGTTRNAKGTGLGLYIVRGLARAQAGEVWYEHNLPRGSCFAVRLPQPG